MPKSQWKPTRQVLKSTRLKGYRDAGVNRMSLGFQAMNDKDLRALGRLHSAEEARACGQSRSFDF